MMEVVVPCETHVPIRATHGVLRLDPRVKLAMLVVANMMMFLHVGPYAGMMGVLLFSLPLLCGGKIALGVGMLACYAMCPAWTGSPWPWQMRHLGCMCRGCWPLVAQ